MIESNGDTRPGTVDDLSRDVPPALRPPDDAARVASLRALQMLDTPFEERFDRVTRLAQQLFGVPIVLVTLVDLDRQWFKSCIGLDERETSRDVSFCTHAILQDDPLVIEDATRDPRFADNPSVVSGPGIRAYAGMPLRAPDGHKLGTLCVIDSRPRDFSPADLAALRDLAGIVENELGAVELNGALAVQRATAAELERLSVAKSEFVSIVSHEFRTALTGMLGFSDLLREGELQPDEVCQFGELIGDTARRLNRLITDLLDLDRIESGRFELHCTPVPLNDVVRQSVLLLQSALSPHGPVLDLDPSEPHVNADDDRLIQVVQNLLTNAIKYSPGGGTIEVQTRCEGETVCLSVRDHGLGIADADRERVFERYTRVDVGHGHSILGTGLGLPIVRQLVELHGGRVWAESAPGGGSVFQVTLPLHQQP